MALMDEQYYSQVFRRRHPPFNGLIWAYHWLQVGLYEPLVTGAGPSERRAGIDTAVARFWEMVRGGVTSMPRVMPMTAAPCARGAGARAPAPLSRGVQPSIDASARSSFCFASRASGSMSVRPVTPSCTSGSSAATRLLDWSSSYTITLQGSSSPMSASA